MPDAIALRGVTKTFGQKVAVQGLDLVVPEGALYGFIGPNGAGKTTTIRMIMSILFPDRGELSVLGRRSALEMKDRIRYLPEERGLYKKMKVGAFLAYMSRLKGKDDAGVGKRVSKWPDRIGLGEVEGKKCEELSKGMQQKLQFLVAIINEPDLLILDEPFGGLDPINHRLLRELVLEQNRSGTTVIFSTHVMQQAELICDSVVMTHNGIKVLDETLASVRKRFDPRTILFEPLDSNAASLLFYMVIFFLIAYFIIGSLMAAIGSAVNDMREAQALMAPVMLVQVLPWILWLPISRNPDSLFSVVLSFLPPINCFVMLLRMTSSTPPPLWQVGISSALGLAAAYGALLFAGKVFRIGLLMFGKPPDFRTLVRWVRMA